jgi:hypothetical protein
MGRQWSEGWGERERKRRGFGVLFPLPVCLSVILPLSRLLLFCLAPGTIFLWVALFLFILGSARFFLLDLAYLCAISFTSYRALFPGIVPLLLMPSVSSGLLFSPPHSASHFCGIPLPFSLFLFIVLFVYGAVSVLLPSRVIAQICQRSVKNKLFATVPDSSINSWESWFIFNLQKINNN